MSNYTPMYYVDVITYPCPIPAAGYLSERGPCSTLPFVVTYDYFTGTGTVMWLPQYHWCGADYRLIRDLDTSSYTLAGDNADQ